MSSPLAVLMPGFAGTELPVWVADALERGLGGVCLFADNIASPEQLRTLTDAVYALNPLAIVSVDEEGGDVTRLFQRVGSPFPGNAVLGRLDDLDATAAVGAGVGVALAKAGIGLTLAPDVDVNSNPLNPVIGVRAFGADADVVARHGVAWVRGLRSAGVAACAKHFPGHGDTAQDSHLALPVVDADLETLTGRELVPFRALVDHGVESIMTSHIIVEAIDPGVPATFSRRILTELLRDEWGFQGVVVTDALDMAGASAERGMPAAAVAALRAGADLLCLGPYSTAAQVEAVSEAIAEAVAAAGGTGVPQQRIDEAAARVRALGGAIAHRREATPTAGAAPTDGRVPAAVPDLERIGSTFDVGGRVAALVARASALTLVAVRTEANIAVGNAPWGPFALGHAADATLHEHASVSELIGSLPRGRQVVVIGKDLHRYRWLSEALERLRAECDAIIVDMGWPGAGPGRPDIATYGASRPVAQALMNLIGRGSCA